MNTLTHVPLPIKYEINLPKINFKKNKTTRPPLKQTPLLFSHQQCTEELAKLDQWTNSLPTVRRKRNQTSESIMFLYKTNNKYNSHGNRHSQNKQAVVASVGLYLAQLDAQLTKIKKINYNAIFQNVEYCAGVYEIAFNDIFKKLESMRKMLQDALKSKLVSIEEFREKKISEMRAKKQKLSDKKSQYQRSYFARQLTQNRENDFRSSFEDSSPKSGQRQPKNDMNQKTKILMDFKQALEDKYKQLKPINIMLQKIEKSRLKVLYFSLELGFDIRQEGLVWILKQINRKILTEDESSPNKENNPDAKPEESPIKGMKNYEKENEKSEQKHIPKMSQFPSFLTEQQIKFIISKFKNDFKLKVIQSQKLQKQEGEKAILQNAFENVRRDRNRKLSMIKEKQLLEKLLNQKKSEVAIGHRYITAETIRLMQNSQKIKCTQNQLIYQQTLRKLNRFCVQQITNKKQKNLQTSISNQNSSTSINIQSINANGNNEQVQRLIQELKKMISQTRKLEDKEERIKTEEERQLADILMKLRKQKYEGRICSDCRNPINVIACLVGWKKAAKILQNQMNIFVPGCHQK